MWTYPGFPSLTVPYPDINDFYFSGHIGTCTIGFLESRANKFNKISIFCMFVLINEWFMMTTIRTHFIIDLVSGAILAHMCFMLGEQVAYFADYKLIGLPGHKRNLYHFSYCKSCQWP